VVGPLDGARQLAVHDGHAVGRVGLAGVVEGGITRAAAPLALGVGAGGEVFFNDLAQEV
jgi:hypothetical protein